MKCFLGITHPDLYFINQLRNNRNEGDFWPIFRPGCGQAEFQQRQAMLPLVPNGSGWFQVESYMCQDSHTMQQWRSCKNRTDGLSSKSSSDQDIKNFLHWQHLQTIHTFSFIVRGDLTKNLPEICQPENPESFQSLHSFLARPFGSFGGTFLYCG